MEASERNQYLEIYKVIKTQSADGDFKSKTELITPVFAKLLKSTYKDFIAKDFSGVNSVAEKNFILRYELKNFITTKNRVLYEDSWYEILEIEPDESTKKELKVRLRLLK